MVEEISRYLIKFSTSTRGINGNRKSNEEKVHENLEHLQLVIFI